MWHSSDEDGDGDGEGEGEGEGKEKEKEKEKDGGRNFYNEIYVPSQLATSMGRFSSKHR